MYTDIVGALYVLCIEFVVGFVLMGLAECMRTLY
jgi:hypothetical protein